MLLGGDEDHKIDAYEKRGGEVEKIWTANTLTVTTRYSLDCGFALVAEAMDML